jgi:hypothetical protein
MSSEILSMASYIVLGWELSHTFHETSISSTNSHLNEVDALNTFRKVT